MMCNILRCTTACGVAAAELRLKILLSSFAGNTGAYKACNGDNKHLEMPHLSHRLALQLHDDEVRPSDDSQQSITCLDCSPSRVNVLLLVSCYMQLAECYLDLLVQGVPICRCRQVENHTQQQQQQHLKQQQNLLKLHVSLLLRFVKHL
jgi:hypothetical protein